jgi:hypothetical protein
MFGWAAIRILPLCRLPRRRRGGGHRAGARPARVGGGLSGPSCVSGRFGNDRGLVPAPARRHISRAGEPSAAERTLAVPARPEGRRPAAGCPSTLINKPLWSCDSAG